MFDEAILQPGTMIIGGVTKVKWDRGKSRGRKKNDIVGGGRFELSGTADLREEGRVLIEEETCDRTEKNLNVGGKLSTRTYCRRGEVTSRTLRGGSHHDNQAVGDYVRWKPTTPNIKIYQWGRSQTVQSGKTRNGRKGGGGRGNNIGGKVVV